FLLYLFSNSSILHSETNSVLADSDISKMLPYFYDLWKETGFGTDPAATERAVWIIRSEQGGIHFHRWPASGERSKEIWVGDLQKNLVAQAHTHPAKKDPKPSVGDCGLSKKINLPIYTISGNGIWKVTPDGMVTLAADRNWYKIAKQMKVQSLAKSD